MFVSQGLGIEAVGILSSKSGTITLLPQELHSASQHQAVMALNCVSVCALTRLILCILSKLCPKLIASSMYVTLPLKVFIIRLYFLIVLKPVLRP